MSIGIGATLGAYEITAFSARGDMGRVLRARDTRLKRGVAIKAVPDEFAIDARAVVHDEHRWRTGAKPSKAAVCGGS